MSRVYLSLWQSVLCVGYWSRRALPIELTLERCKYGTIALLHVNFSGYVGHAVISWMLFLCAVWWYGLGSCYGCTRCGRSRAQHVRDREADIETAKSWGLEHLQHLKGEARRAEPTFGLYFRAKAPKEMNGGPSQCFGYGSFVEERLSSGEDRRAEPTSPFSWRLIKNTKF